MPFDADMQDLSFETPRAATSHLSPKQKAAIVVRLLLSEGAVPALSALPESKQTELAIQLARNGSGVALWGHDPAEVEALQRDGDRCISCRIDSISLVAAMPGERNARKPIASRVKNKLRMPGRGGRVGV